MCQDSWTQTMVGSTSFVLSSAAARFKQSNPRRISCSSNQTPPRESTTVAHSNHIQHNILLKSMPVNRFVSRVDRMFGDTGPTVIDQNMLREAVVENTPPAILAKMDKKDTIDFSKVKELRLDYSNILTIWNLDDFENLTNLQLDNNIIQRINGLSRLVNLKRLDLSFNRIRKIEGLKTLLKLEDLSLYHNEISRIEQIHKLDNLKILSIGCNKIEDLNELRPMVRLPNLVALTLEGNPIAMRKEYRDFIIVYFSKLKYIDNRYINQEERTFIRESNVHEIEKNERHLEAIREEEDQEAKDDDARRMYKRACCDKIEGNMVYDSIFEDDADGRRFNEIPQMYENARSYKESLRVIFGRLFKICINHYNGRLQEEAQLRQAIKSAVDSNNDIGRNDILVYESLRDEMTARLTNSADNNYDFAENLFSQMREHLHEMENKLLKLEEHLYEQICEVMEDYGQNIGEFVASTHENIHNYISQCRDSLTRYNDLSMDYVLAYNDKLAKLNNEDFAKWKYTDKETIVGCIMSSKDLHNNYFDMLLETMQKGVSQTVEENISSLIEELQEKSHYSRLYEIAHYIEKEFSRIDMITLTYYVD